MTSLKLIIFAAFILTVCSDEVSFGDDFGMTKDSAEARQLEVFSINSFPQTQTKFSESTGICACNV